MSVDEVGAAPSSECTVTSASRATFVFSMKTKNTTVTPVLAAAGIALGVAGAPAALADDPCDVAVGQRAAARMTVGGTAARGQAALSAPASVP
ncbi:hypothetical protein [Mycolicibacterium sp. 050158]|uniref:hypothetical protein n=1 Tax=Mycolicibacterium sp. 050158 TaxID=3090602 RepID=UPI00299EFC8F|nr:hypothetical protein [Mycolicibacterium sp. 050158]MDX1892390.1 hypothetical protein [Mycolicibacterium sp. 050158]